MYVRGPHMVYQVIFRSISVWCNRVSAPCNLHTQEPYNPTLEIIIQFPSIRSLRLPHVLSQPGLVFHLQVMAKKLDRRLESLGATAVIERGLGDDQVGGFGIWNVLRGVQPCHKQALAGSA